MILENINIATKEYIEKMEELAEELKSIATLEAVVINSSCLVEEVELLGIKEQQKLFKALVESSFFDCSDDIVTANIDDDKIEDVAGTLIIAYTKMSGDEDYWINYFKEEKELQ